MPRPTRFGLGEAAITATLLSIYLSARGTNRALGAVQAAMGGTSELAVSQLSGSKQTGSKNNLLGNDN